MSRPKKTQDYEQHEHDDAEPSNDGELSIEELEDAAGGTGEFPPPPTDAEC